MLTFSPANDFDEYPLKNFKGGSRMCPYMKETICEMAGISPEHLECAKIENCNGDGWKGCNTYISQFFFDSNDEYIGGPCEVDVKAA